jgi:MFS family permease
MTMTQTIFPNMVRGTDTSGLLVGKRAPLALGRRASFWVSFGVSVHTLWTSAAPALAYRLYAEEWRLPHAVTTGVFAIYPVFVVATLVLFGDISDHIGRRATMLLGLAASLAGTLMFAVAPNVLWLFVARAIMGIGVGLTSGSSTAAILEYGADGRPDRAASATAVAQAIGFAVARAHPVRALAHALELLGARSSDRPAHHGGVVLAAPCRVFRLR